MSVPLPIRRSARLVIIEPEGRLLLFHYHDGHGDPFWSTAGGELRKGEDYLQAAARELDEETGFETAVGSLLRERDDVYAIARSGPARWIEKYFLVVCTSAEAPDRLRWTEEERETIRHWRWWSLEEMRREELSRFRPPWLPDLLEETLDEVCPAAEGRRSESA